MFRDKITKQIAESVKEVLETKEEVPPVPPVVMGRLPDSAKKKAIKKFVSDKAAKMKEKNPPVVRLGQGDYQRDYTEKNLGPAIDVPEKARKLAGKVKGMAQRLMGRKG